MREKRKRSLLILARYTSLLFTPFYLPMMGLAALFLFSYLSLLPLIYKAMVLLMVYCFTILLPHTMMHLYRRYQGWSVLKLFSREGRMVPYVISIASYVTCYYIMNLMHMPHFMSSIVMAAIAIQVICALINHKWKISTHTAAIGGTTGAVAAFSLIFGFYPLWWLCTLIILAGVVGTGRMLLRQHTLGEITVGYIVGVLSGFWAVMLS